MTGWSYPEALPTWLLSEPAIIGTLILFSRRHIMELNSARWKMKTQNSTISNILWGVWKLFLQTRWCGRDVMPVAIKTIVSFTQRPAMCSDWCADAAPVGTTWRDQRSASWHTMKEEAAGTALDKDDKTHMRFYKEQVEQTETSLTGQERLHFKWFSVQNRFRCYSVQNSSSFSFS